MDKFLRSEVFDMKFSLDYIEHRYGMYAGKKLLSAINSLVFFVVTLTAVNNLGIGPQGFGGMTTALAVNIEKFPTHIAGLPVAVNINCHVTRHSSEVI